MTPSEKQRVLLHLIRERRSMLVAFSGGVDSCLLAVLAKEQLGEKTRCLLLDSPVVPRSAVEQAQMTAREQGLVLEIIAVPLMEHGEFWKNPRDRCYYCKKISAQYLKKRALQLGFSCIADGTNLSDTKEHRPGLRASTEEGILHPFIEAGITKQDIRDIAQERGLPIWKKPSAACLASRIPYGQEITPETLRMIEEAEAVLASRGFSQVRVRMHGPVARIEVLPSEMERAFSLRDELTEMMKKTGLSYVTLDLEGFRSGSMDEVL